MLCKCVFSCISIGVFVYNAYKCVYAFACVCLYECVYVCMSVCVCA